MKVKHKWIGIGFGYTNQYVEECHDYDIFRFGFGWDRKGSGSSVITLVIFGFGISFEVIKKVIE